MESSHYNILITPSSEYFNQALVVMMSAIVNCKYPCRFYIMQRTWTEQQKEECRTFISGYSENTIEFIDVDENDFKSFMPWRGRFGTYYKLLAHLYLPESVDRILYMDCDSFINKDIYNYYTMDFEDNYLIGSTETLSLQFYNQIRQSLEQHGYMNGGVVLLNIKKLREENITKETYLNVVSKFDGYYFADQGIASYVFDGKIKLLPSYKYNHLMFQEGTENRPYSYKKLFSTPFQERTKLFVKEYWNEEFDEQENATIVHFTGIGIKPWQCKIKLQENDFSIDIPLPLLNKANLSADVVYGFYFQWWKIASKLPSKYFKSLISQSEDEINELLKSLSDSLSGTERVLNFFYEVCMDNCGEKRFIRYIKHLQNKNVAVLRQSDKAGVFFTKYLTANNVNIVFRNNQINLMKCTQQELEECRKADVVFTCHIHGTKTHERDGIKCIDIWDILRDKSLTADLPPLNEKSVINNSNEDLKNQIADLQSEIDKASQQLSRNALELVHINEKIKQLETEMEKR